MRWPLWQREHFFSMSASSGEGAAFWALTTTGNNRQQVSTKIHIRRMIPPSRWVTVLIASPRSGERRWLPLNKQQRGAGALPTSRSASARG